MDINKLEVKFTNAKTKKVIVTESLTKPKENEELWIGVNITNTGDKIEFIPEDN